jgi:hypothetical protein
MTYFSFRHIRGTRSDAVYVGPMLVGRIALKTDWRSRITVSDKNTIQYRATDVGGAALPVLFASRHDAAEALYEVAHGASGAGLQ